MNEQSFYLIDENDDDDEAANKRVKKPRSYLRDPKGEYGMNFINDPPDAQMPPVEQPEGCKTEYLGEVEEIVEIDAYNEAANKIYKTHSLRDPGVNAKGGPEPPKEPPKKTNFNEYDNFEEYEEIVEIDSEGNIYRTGIFVKKNGDK